jgi:hypothetical protein
MQACVPECRAHEGQEASGLNPLFLHNLASCLDRLECQRIDDVCLHDGFQAVMRRDPRASGLVQRCRMKRNACGGGWRDDYCFSLAALSEARRQAATACLEQPCGHVGPCLTRAGAFNY